MKVAVVHDWMTLAGGGELCVAEFLAMFPQADLFCLVDALPEAERGFLAGHTITTSFIQRLPWAKTRHRAYLPLMPLAIEQLDVTAYDLVISTSSAVAKGVITGPDQIHISYTFSPIRYAWDAQHVYLAESRLTRGLKSMLARAVLHYLRLWDTRTSNGVDHFVAISNFIARRIRKAYGRSSTVIYPPVDLDRFSLSEERDDVYVTASRLVPYKHIVTIVEAFRLLPDRRLIVIGDGPEMPAVRRAAGQNVEILGRLSQEAVVGHVRRAKAFLFAAEEDFGIAPLEAQACGTPVIAYRKGAATETIVGDDVVGQTGIFFREQTAASIAQAIRHLDTRQSFITPAACRANAERFRAERFRTEMRSFIDAAMSAASPASV